MRGARHVWGGRREIRAVLYMASLTAIRYDQVLRNFYQSLRARGKAAKVAIVATMRKMLVILNARMRDALLASPAAGWSEDSCSAPLSAQSTHPIRNIRGSGKCTEVLEGAALIEEPSIPTELISRLQGLENRLREEATIRRPIGLKRPPGTGRGLTYFSIGQ